MLPLRLWGNNCVRRGHLTAPSPEGMSGMSGVFQRIILGMAKLPINVFGDIKIWRAGKQLKLFKCEVS